LQDVPQRRLLGAIAPDGRQIDVARPVLVVPDVAFFLEDPQHRPDGRVAGRVRQGSLDLSGRRAALRIKNVHDLPFAAAQVVVGRLTHQQ
jgi:hypothetical protein